MCSMDSVEIKLQVVSYWWSHSFWALMWQTVTLRTTGVAQLPPNCLWCNFLGGEIDWINGRPLNRSSLSLSVDPWTHLSAALQIDPINCETLQATLQATQQGSAGTIRYSKALLIHFRQTNGQCTHFWYYGKLVEDKLRFYHWGRKVIRCSLSLRRVLVWYTISHPLRFY